MSVNAKDLYKLLDDIDHHARSIISMQTTLRSMLSQMPLRDTPPEFECPKCGVPRVTERDLAFHMQNVHDGPRVPLTPQEEAA